jgi:2-iminoacetate synthase
MGVSKSTDLVEARILDRISTGAAAGNDTAAVCAVLDKAIELKGLSPDDVAVLMSITDPLLLGDLFHTAQAVKEKIYGTRLVLFAPLYISNLCRNDCAYCAFRCTNRTIKRHALGTDEIAAETRMLVEQGHKRLLLVAGEAYPREGLDYILNAIDTVYATRSGNGEIRRINVNIAPLETDQFRALKERQIGTYQIFQETYHRPTYSKVHLRGPKADYDWRLAAMDRAMTAGIDDVGIGVLFGLADWRYEVLAMLDHIHSLEDKFGVGPHTISIPRIEPAAGSELSNAPTAPVSDQDFRKLVAILRLAVPYTGIIMSTRETVAIRRETLALGISQISAGSRTNPGGYSEEEGDECGQFSLGDHRPLDEVIRDVAQHGYIPSFCTGCYRLGRTGQDFMDLARPGEIKNHCDPNGLSTFLEYLVDYASPETRAIGEHCITQALDHMHETPRQRAVAMLAKVRLGERDVFC